MTESQAGPLGDTMIENDFIDMVKYAIIDKSTKYRYLLGRFWKQGGEGRCVFLMLNPSTADAMVEDPTIRRCMTFARAWGYKQLDVLNLFAFRATQPVNLPRSVEAVGPSNDYYITNVCREAKLVVAAWGVHGAILNRDVEVASGLLKDRELHCLGTTKEGQPKHPLYIDGATHPGIWGGRRS
jgi:hypothetical protein